MKFKFEGRWEPQALAEKIEQHLGSFCQQYGIKSLTGVNLYFHMYDEEGNQIELEGPDNQVIVAVTFKNPNVPKRVRKKKGETGTVIPFQQKDGIPETR